MSALSDETSCHHRSARTNSAGNTGPICITNILPRIVRQSTRTQALGSTSLRMLTPEMLRYRDMSERFAGLPDGVRHFHVLKTFQHAATALCLKPWIVITVEWLFRFSGEQDWLPGARPIVWPSTARMCAEFGISRSTTKTLIRTMSKLGLVVMRDGPSGRRQGLRKAERIVGAYDFDLSLLAIRLAEFEQLTAQWRVAQARLKRLRQERTLASNAAIQMLATLRYAVVSEAIITDFAERMRVATAAAKLAKTPAALEASIAVLLDLASEGRAAIADRQQQANVAAALASKSGPEGPENRPQTLTKEAESKKVSVVAHEGELEAAGGLLPAAGSDSSDRSENAQTGRDGDAGENALSIRPADLAHLVPAMRPYISSARPTWPDIVEAAWHMRAGLGISQRLWGDACVALGRDMTALAMVVVASKPASYFTSSPAAYFAELVARGRNRTLNLDRSLRALRQRAAAGDRDGRSACGRTSNCPP